MIQYQVDLTHLNTLKLAATAQAYARFTSVTELIDLLQQAKAEKLPVKVLGGGSNVLLEGNIAGLVVQSAMSGIYELLPDEDYARIAVDAGVIWHDWVQQSIHYGHGLENLALIPGTVGAAPIQNIGAYGVEVADFIETVKGVQISTLSQMELKPEQCQFSYRDSVFKHTLKDDFIITQVVFKLPFEFKPKLTYGPLQGLESARLTPERLIQKICDVRNSKLPSPAETPNAGSFFKNPVVASALASKLKENYPDMPQYVQTSGEVKLAAGWLIEQVGFKGVWQGNVRMHDQQALVLTTNGKASFAEVMALKEQVVSAVNGKFGIVLEAEPQVF